MAFEWLQRFTNWMSPGDQPEQREALVGGDSAINQLLDRYYSTGGQADVSQTAVVEFILRSVGMAFMSATPQPALPALTPSTLSMLGRQTIGLGNAVMEVTVDRRTGQPELAPVAKYTIQGNVQPRTWRYTIRQQMPNGEMDHDTESLTPRNIPYDGIVHVRYSPRPSRPWRGVSPFESAGMTADQLAKIERSLTLDAGAASGPAASCSRRRH